MFGRRGFLVAACCAAHCGTTSRATAQPGDWICGTVDKATSFDTPMALDRFSADAGFDKQVVDAAVRDFKLTPFGTARLQDRWRRGDGLTPNTGRITLGVHFLNGNEGQKALVRQAADQWLAGELGTLVQFRFDVPRASAQLTVNLLSDRNNSIVGRTSADYARVQATMNFVDIVDHIAMHEFGHALGLDHEHQNPGVAIQWNRAAVIADMAKQGWTPEMCEQNIFTRYGSEYACVGDPSFNKESIMLYPTPRSWTLDGFSSGTNADISERDRSCILGIYRT